MNLWAFLFCAIVEHTRQRTSRLSQLRFIEYRAKSPLWGFVGMSAISVRKSGYAILAVGNLSRCQLTIIRPPNFYLRFRRHQLSQLQSIANSVEKLSADCVVGCMAVGGIPLFRYIRFA